MLRELSESPVAVLRVLVCFESARAGCPVSLVPRRFFWPARLVSCTLLCFTESAGSPVAVLRVLGVLC